ncbi:hypothetical protein HHK36_011820 [Tetracentron sinense]|uniref:FAR1 domain-containing protein n=1 Tax=Tetracentron sinense TaxID=13715 RepID=A0A834ZH37_TETSI|nr:hypothetical protein HHK36_011820 [Tetracentron sinense]
MMEIDLGLHGDKYDMKDIRLNVDRNTMNYTDEGHDDDEGDVTFSTIEPYLEMEFNSKEEAYSFCREYAKSIGFGTSKLNSRRSRVSGEFIDAKFVCCKYGRKQRSNVEVANPRPNHKTNCKAIDANMVETKSGKAPKAIVTDQDKAMKATIAEGQSTSMSLNFDGYVLQQNMQGLLQSVHGDLHRRGEHERIIDNAPGFHIGHSIEGKLEEVILLNPTSGIMYSVKGQESKRPLKLHIIALSEAIAAKWMSHSYYLNKIAVDMDPQTAEQTDRLIAAIAEFIKRH